MCILLFVHYLLMGIEKSDLFGMDVYNTLDHVERCY